MKIWKPLFAPFRNWVMLGFMLAHLGVAHAFIPPGDGGGGGDEGDGGGGGGGGGTPLSRCLANTSMSLDATPPMIDVGGTATLSWSIRPPSWCSLFNRVLVNGRNFGLMGSVVVQPMMTTHYPLTLIVPGGFQTLGPITVTVNGSGIVNLSPGSQVTAHDIAQFNTRWMNAGDLAKRLSEYEYWLKNRQPWIAWGVGDDTSAMVRMFELTRDWKYLDHLRAVNNVALQYRDDNHLGDDFPLGDNPICMNCRPPFVDRERGMIVPAWGSGILYGDYVSDGGLTPVDAVTSGVYAYGMAAFARLVAEDTSLQDVYGADAMKFANATIQTMWAFMPQFDAWQISGGYTEGTIKRPHLFPTASQCAEARDRAVQHVRQYSKEEPDGIADLLNRIADAKRDNCDRAGRYAAKPLAHNESGSLMMSFIELWRALDSNFYRTSSLRASNADLTRGVIPLVVTRHQRHFFNRLDLRNAPQGQRYWWNYNDGVPDPHREDTSHGNLDMSYVNTLRGSFDRLNASVPSGEPIALDDAMLQRFANTFLQQIARPEEIDRGGNLRADVDGRSAADLGKASDYYNPLCDGWVNLAAVNATVYRMCRDVVLRTSTRGGSPEIIQAYLSIANHSALLANKRFADQPPSNIVPDLRGKTFAEADGALRAAGLVVGRVSGVVDDTCNKLGLVASHSPSRDTQLPAGAAVDLNIWEKPRAPRVCN